MNLPTPSNAHRAVVTGASSGIGAALAESLAKRGHNLMIVARRARRLEELAEHLRATYAVTVDIAVCDLADGGEREDLIRLLSDIDVSVLCLNAGFATYGSIATLDTQREREQVQLNVVAVHDLVLAVVPRMVRRRAGAILVTGSTAGNQPSPNNSTYAASKAFANTLAESLHCELAEANVTCTLLAPGPVQTEFAEVADLGATGELLPAFAWVSADQAADAAINGLMTGRRRVVPGPTAKLQDIGGRYAPRSILSPILRRAYGRR